MTTDQPRRASSTALGAPMPDDAPVTMATLVMARESTASASTVAGAAVRSSAEQLLVGVAQLRQLGLAARAGIGDRFAAGDRDANLVVVLELGLGAARP